MYEQQEFMEKMVAEHKEDPFWRNVGLILAQYNGLVDGYYHAAPGDMVQWFCDSDVFKCKLL